VRGHLGQTANSKLPILEQVLSMLWLAVTALSFVILERSLSGFGKAVLGAIRKQASQ
jgi:hypothetical protein